MLIRLFKPNKMSRNRNRAKLNKANNGREYEIILNSILYPVYSEYDHTWWHGDLSNDKWRSYKSWKHNRKTKFKDI
jgi:hypothetical protein